LLFDENLAAGVVDQGAVVAGLAGIGDLGEVAVFVIGESGAAGLEVGAGGVGGRFSVAFHADDAALVGVGVGDACGSGGDIRLVLAHIAHVVHIGVVGGGHARASTVLHDLLGEDAVGVVQVVAALEDTAKLIALGADFVRSGGLKRLKINPLTRPLNKSTLF
jgi:hypothetical protein